MMPLTAGQQVDFWLCTGYEHKFSDARAIASVMLYFVQKLPGANVYVYWLSTEIRLGRHCID